MGKGKGSPEYYACRVKPGRIILKLMEYQRKLLKLLYIKHQQNYQLKQSLLEGKFMPKKKEDKKLTKDQAEKNYDFKKRFIQY